MGLDSPSGVMIAIDGGNSKTDVAVYEADGTVLATLRGPGVSQHDHGTQGAVIRLEELMQTALADAGLKLGRDSVRHTAAYLAGVDLPREQAAIADAVAKRDWSSTVTLENDTFALLRMGSRRGVGVAVVCGAGINCVAVGTDDRVIRFPSLGDISGDWGGGSRLATEVMFAAARAEDGRGPATALVDAVLRHFEADTILSVIESLHFREIPHRRLHELNPLLFSAALGGDAIAVELLERLASEIAMYALTALERLGLLESEVPLVLGGSMLAARNPIVVSGIEERVRARAKRAEIVIVDSPPIVGAALLGLDTAFGTASDSAEKRLRAHWADRSIAIERTV